jgi:putative transposase
MREQHLLVPPTLRLKAKRTPQGSQPKPTKPNEWWGIDMTKGLVEGVGWVYIVIVLDWYTKAVVEPYAGLRCTAMQWLEALDMAVNRQFPQGARGRGLTTTTSIISTQLWGTRRPCRLSGTITPAIALRSWPLDKRGAL